MSSPVEDAIFAALAEVEAGKSVSPEAVARAVDAEGWRRVLPQVKATAVGLARQGKLVILRHGKPVDTEGFKGVWRMRAPDPESPLKALGISLDERTDGGEPK
jgi:hypothetical protein